MKQLQITSLIMLILGIVGLILFRFVLIVPDWAFRTTGILLLISISTTTFSSVKLNQKGN